MQGGGVQGDTAVPSNTSSQSKGRTIKTSGSHSRHSDHYIVIRLFKSRLHVLLCHSLNRAFAPKTKTWQKSGNSYIMKGFNICALHP
jgi:hypothetical protein